MLKLDAFIYDAHRPLLFTSGTFLALFTLFLLGFIALPIGAARSASLARRATFAKLAYLYAFSLFFYYKSSGWFVGLLLLMTLADFCLARHESTRHRDPVRERAMITRCTGLRPVASPHAATRPSGPHRSSRSTHGDPGRLRYR